LVNSSNRGTSALTRVADLVNESDIEETILKIIFVDYLLPVALLLRTQVFCDALSNEFTFRFDPPTNLDVSDFKALVFTEVPYTVTITGREMLIAVRRLEITPEHIQVSVYGDYFFANMILERIVTIIGRSLATLGFDINKQPFIKKLTAQVNVVPSWKNLFNLLDLRIKNLLWNFGMKQLQDLNDASKIDSINYSSKLSEVHLIKALADIVPTNSFFQVVSLTLEHINTDAHRLNRLKIAGNFQPKDALAWVADLTVRTETEGITTTAINRIELTAEPLVQILDIMTTASRLFTLHKLPLVWLVRAKFFEQLIDSAASAYCIETNLLRWQWINDDTVAKNKEPADWKPLYLLLQGGRIKIADNWEPFINLKVASSYIAVTSPKGAAAAEKILDHIEKVIFSFLSQHFTNSYNLLDTKTEFSTQGRIKMKITPFSVLNAEVQAKTVDHFSKILRDANLTYSESRIETSNAEIESIHLFNLSFVFFPEGRSSKSTELKIWFNEYNDYYNKIWNFFAHGKETEIIELFKQINQLPLQDMSKRL
jgi:hypothetical protein